MLKMKSALSWNGILRFSVVRTTGYLYRRISVCDGTELQPILTAMATKNAESMPAVWCSQLRPPCNAVRYPCLLGNIWKWVDKK